jgi:hypothetical protein
MVMRYHWGLAVGHRYTHDSISGNASSSHNYDGTVTNPQHAHVNNDSDNELEVDVEERSAVIASGSKERQPRISDASVLRESGHSQACAPEQTESHETMETGSDGGHSQDDLEMSLEDREFEDWYIDSDDCDNNLDSDGDYDCDSDPTDVDHVVSDIDEY